MLPALAFELVPSHIFCTGGSVAIGSYISQGHKRRARFLKGTTTPPGKTCFVNAAARSISYNINKTIQGSGGTNSCPQGAIVKRCTTAAKRFFSAGYPQGWGYHMSPELVKEGSTLVVPLDLDVF